jgi:hypothetical protein
MLKQRHFPLLITALTVFVLVAAACGSDSDVGSTTGEVPQVDDSDGGLPLADADVDTPAVSGLCAPGEPDCEDTLADDPEPQDLPQPSDDDVDTDTADGGVSSGMTVDGGRTISEALTTNATGVIAIRGHLFDDSSGLQLCESLVGLGERYDCDGEHIAVTNLDPTEVPDIVFFEGTTYTEDEITLFGELNEGTLTVDPLVSG